MKIQINKNVIRLKSNFIMLSLMLFASCEMIIPVDIPDHKPQIVLNAILDPDEPLYVNVSKSLSIIDRAELPPIENAVVEIYENNNFLQVLPYISYGYYGDEDFFPKPDMEYQIRVKAKPFDSVYAITKIPALPQNTEPHLKDSVKKSDFESLASVKFGIIDEPGKVNYYEITLLSALGYMIYPTIEDPSIETFYGSDGILFSDNRFNGTIKSIELLFPSYTLYDRGFNNDTLFMNEPHIFLIVSSVNEDYFKYRKTASKQAESRDNPFAEPVQVFGNINNGFGIFAAKRSNYFLLIK
jgi:hypothetical protein